MVSENVKKIIRMLSLTGVLLFIAVLFVQSLGLFATGFESESILQQYFFYTAPAIGFLLGILIFWFIEFLIKKDDNKYGNSIGYSNQGEYPSLPYFKKFSNFRLFLGSLIIFSILGFTIFIFGNQGTFTGLQILPQQFSEAASLMFSSALIPISENAGAGFFIAFLFWGIRRLARKYSWKKANFLVLSWVVIPMISGVYGVLNHVLRYSSSETALYVVFFFWLIGGLITILTGSFIPFVVMHFANNFFYDIKRLLDIDVMKFYIIGAIVVLIILYLYLYTFRKKKQKNINNI